MVFVWQFRANERSHSEAWLAAPDASSGWCSAELVGGQVRRRLRLAVKQVGVKAMGLAAADLGAAEADGDAEDLFLTALNGAGLQVNADGNLVTADVDRRVETSL